MVFARSHVLSAPRVRLNIPGEKVLVVDEAWAYQTVHSRPIELKTIVQSGRKRGLRLIVNIQEPNRLNGAILNAVSEFVCFRLQSPRALDLVKRYYGFAPEEVSNLQMMQFIAGNTDSGGELRGQFKL